MACIDLTTNVDSEMEEGEIVDDADALSDISSEEEFLLRQRLHVLESYNNVLERKEAKRTSIGSAPALNQILGKEHPRREVLCDVSEISSNTQSVFKKMTLRIENHKPRVKPYPRPRKLKSSEKQFIRIKEHKKKNHRKKKIETKKLDSDSSEDEDYHSKRRKLANAVSFNKAKNESSTLKDRLTKMLGGNKTEITKPIHNKKCENIKDIIENPPEIIKVPCSKEEGPSLNHTDEKIVQSEEGPSLNHTDEEIVQSETLKIASNYLEDKPKNILSENKTEDVVEFGGLQKEDAIHNSEGTSDEDLELLRQHALKTKSGIKNDLQKKNDSKNKTDIISEDEDSDTTELRMICLKSALLKKAIEMKQKQKLQKRLSQSSNMHDMDINNQEDVVNIDNNTDTESVDMEIGSDGDDKGKVYITECTDNTTRAKMSTKKSNVTKERLDDELEEDEDLLRAKLLTSLSKNMPNLVDLKVLDTTLNKLENKCDSDKTENPPKNVEKKKFIIHIGESDSEGEHEATKNLTKMHRKLSEQAEFQQKLDQFLKSTRMEVEKTTPSDVVQPPVFKTPEKIVAKTVNHLPKSEQLEYKNLLKRVAELEKIKQARQNTLTMNKPLPAPKDTLKPRNVSMEAYKLATAKKVEMKIALSRKRIAEESAKMLKLKEEATKLSQRYKIVAAELRNLTTAITLNKKQQKIVQNGLFKIRNQHQILLKSSPINFTNRNIHLSTSIGKLVSNTKLQKENDPLKKEEYKNPNNLKTVKVSVANDLNDKNAGNPKTSIQVDISNNKKTVKLPKSPLKDRIVDLLKQSKKDESLEEKTEIKILDTGSERIRCTDEKNPEDSSDYNSPLNAMQSKNWQEDPNGVLCPFEFSGCCRDADCKYIHTKTPK